MKYPTEIHFYDGPVGVIFPGHGWSEAYCRDAVREYCDTYIPCEKDEDGSLDMLRAHYKYRPRVKWCGSCDSNGDWHPHWETILASEDLETKFTVVYVEC